MQVIYSYIEAHAQLLAVFGFLFFSRLRLLSYLHIFQQEEYDGSRFFSWLVRTVAFDRTVSAVSILASLLDIFLPPYGKIGLSLFLCAMFVAQSWREGRHQKTAKKALVMTRRARRIFEISWFLVSITAVLLVTNSNSPIVWVLAVQSCPLLLVLSNISLIPVENRIKKKYWLEAHDKLRRLAPYTIGVTGSFGKTSTKHILGHILQFLGPTLITPGSVNTAMGISRIIREQLRASHKYFVVEMGAYGPGSIKDLCDLAPPKLGIITAIGSAHLERFGSTAVIAKAKLELATAVLENTGRVVINSATLASSPVSECYASNPKSFITCGSSNAEVLYSDVRQSRIGLEFTITSEGEAHKVVVPLFGTHHALNVALAFSAARAIGMSAKDIVAALRSVPQISHRLEVKRQDTGGLVIDDSYNSNPEGFASALNLLTSLKTQSGKAYLITPGMAELGDEHAEQHHRLGQMASQAADTLFIVCEERIPTFLEGWREQSGDVKTIFRFDTFEDAYKELLNTFNSNDVVLLENDLPDLYERKLAL